MSCQSTILTANKNCHINREMDDHEIDVLLESLHINYERLKELFHNLKPADVTSQTVWMWEESKEKSLSDSMIQTLGTMIIQLGPESSLHARLITMQVLCWYEQSKLVLRHGDKDTSTQILNNAYNAITTSAGKPVATYLAFRLANHLSYLLLKTNYVEQAQLILEVFYSNYKLMKSYEPQYYFYSDDELFSPKQQIQPNDDLIDCFEKLMTTNIQMLCCVYNQQGDHVSFSIRHHEVLRRQLELKDGDPALWASRAAQLATYFLSQGRFKEARHHLAAASHVIEDYESKLKADKALDKPHPKLLETQKRSTDVAKCWVKYGLSLFNTSASELVTTLGMSPSTVLQDLWTIHREDLIDTLKKDEKSKTEETCVEKGNANGNEHSLLDGEGSVGSENKNVSPVCEQFSGDSIVDPEVVNNVVDIGSTQIHLEYESKLDNKPAHEKANTFIVSGENRENSVACELGKNECIVNEQQRDGMKNVNSNSMVQKMNIKLTNEEANRLPTEQKFETVVVDDEFDGNLHQESVGGCENTEGVHQVATTNDKATMQLCEECQCEQNTDFTLLAYEVKTSTVEDVNVSVVVNTVNSVDEPPKYESGRNCTDNNMFDVNGLKTLVECNERSMSPPIMGDLVKDNVLSVAVITNDSVLEESAKRDKVVSGDAPLKEDIPQCNENIKENQKESLLKCCKLDGSKIKKNIIQLGCSDDEDLTFPSLNLKYLEEKVTTDLVSTTLQAQMLFAFTHSWLTKCHTYYSILDHTVDYVNTVFELSDLYRYVGIFEDNLDMQYEIQKRRQDTLESLRIVLNHHRPHSYITMSAELLRELAEVHLELAGENGGHLAELARRFNQTYMFFINIGLNLRRLGQSPDTAVLPKLLQQEWLSNKAELLTDLHDRFDHFNNHLPHCLPNNMVYLRPDHAQRNTTNPTENIKT